MFEISLFVLIGTKVQFRPKAKEYIHLPTLGGTFSRNKLMIVVPDLSWWQFTKTLNLLSYNYNCLNQND